MNSVVERQNRTFKDMMRGIIYHFTLPESFWEETFKTTAYILNRVLTEAIVKTPYKLQTCKNPSLKHLHI